MSDVNRPRGAEPIALTMGEPAGIGPDIALRAWMTRDPATGPRFFLVAAPDLIRSRARSLALEVPIATIGSAAESVHIVDTALPILPLDETVSVAQATVPDPVNAPSVIAAIRTAVSLVLAGEASAVVTNPIAKSALTAAGFAFPGHTEYLGALARNAGFPASPVMMLVGGGLRTVPVTVHIPLVEVPAALSTARVIEITRIVHLSLSRDFAVAKPRLAMTGLNPHAGEDGTLGTEERDIISPAIAALHTEGIAVEGPLPADTAFHETARARYDAVIAMYHDQALIPVKTLAFDEGVNVTLGLPFVRTSPDHGTACDIAGTGQARPDSLIAALRLAWEMAERRAGHAAETAS
jgi:4-hydroxythreonine-4-phosphate dehydrogenase